MHKNQVAISGEDGHLIVQSDTIVSGMYMAGGRPDTTQQGTQVELRAKNLFQYKNVMFAMVNFYKKAELDFEKSDTPDEGIEVLTVDVESKGMHKRVNLTDLSGQNDQAQKVSLGDQHIGLKFGPKHVKLPFAIKLNKFILDRYPGSTSPMSYASEVSIVDSKNGGFNYRIFMNHVLDHEGYRFFQSSYDMDEKGTILSVNHDYWGTHISYLSYILLFIGFVITLIGKHSRFHFLSNIILSNRIKRKALLSAVLLLVASFQLIAQPAATTKVQGDVADRFGHLLVQTMDGRIEPMHTLAYDAMHKISKKDAFDFEGKGSMDAMQVVIDFILDPNYWKQQKMIYVGDQSLSDLLGISGNYAAFNDFIQNGSDYKLSDQVQKSFRKSPSKQNRFDKELIKLDERVNLYYMLIQGTMFRLFPADANAQKWIDWNDSLARQPITGSLALLNQELELPFFTYSTLQEAYFQALMKGTQTGNYARANKIQGFISNIQRSNKYAPYFPGETKIGWEISYNKAGIFKKLVLYYGLISLFLAVFSFIHNVRSKSSKHIIRLQQAGIGLLVLLFLFHTFAMITRWYLSGHAPWSNGYEALLLIAWSSVFAGFFFLKNTTVIQAATSFLACLVLMTAGHSNYDPQLSNLQPVLQSYWLVIHVAVITISYGFLALGFILGFMNMIFYLLKSTNNKQRLELLISELTFINEKNLQVGLFLATLGTFLGGVWASESWGRYWGWDAKETWALVIVLVYSVILHLRLIPKLKGHFIFNTCSIFGFGSVLMTFIGVNYYLSKGLHSYAADDKSVFPWWGWALILSMVALVTAAGLKEKWNHKGERESSS